VNTPLCLQAVCGYLSFKRCTITSCVVDDSDIMLPALLVNDRTRCTVQAFVGNSMSRQSDWTSALLCCQHGINSRHYPPSQHHSTHITSLVLRVVDLGRQRALTPTGSSTLLSLSQVSGWGLCAMAHGHGHGLAKHYKLKK
jgi:hypothetical protein